MSSGQQAGRGEVFHPLADGDPRTVAGYRISARLGAGGMGKVYLSYTPGGRPVAIKVIRPEFSEDPEFRRRFKQEALAAQRVQGLYTAPVIDCDTDGARPWLATAYVPGPSLADAVAAHGPLPVPTVLLLVAGIAEALHVIHGAGIVHRDLKPSNVLLAADGPRVIDFGIARAADATSLTGSGVTIGTPSFMAPEQAAGRAVTAATDLFALGQVAAYAAIGSPAFGEGTGHGVLYRIVHEEPELTALPAELRELVERCLAKDPDGRPTVMDIIRMCQAANSGTLLRRPEDWLPGTVAADITGRTAAPAPAPGAHAAETAPAAAPTAPPAAPSAAPPGATHPPAAPAPAGYPVTGPSGFGPAAATGAQQPYGPHHPLPPQPHGYPVPPPGPADGGARQPKKSRTLAVAVAAAVVFGVAGAGSAYVLMRDNSRDDPSAGHGDSSAGKSPRSKEPSGDGGAEPSGDGSSSGRGQSTGGGAVPAADPEPVDFEAIDLPAGYHLTFDDDPVRPQEGEDGSYDLSYDSGGYLDAERDGGKMVLLDPGQQPTLDTCRAETRFADTIELDSLSKGSRFCVYPGRGDLGLVTVRGFSSEDSPSTYMKLDLRVWRNAAAVESAD